MVEHIPKLNRENYWAVNAPTKSHEDKNQRNQNRRDEQNRERAYKDEFEEFSDFTRLTQKNPKNYKEAEVPRNHIDGLTFRSLSTQNRNATLEVDVKFKDGTIERGVRLALSREEGMGFFGKKLGEPLAVDQFYKGSSILTMGLFRPPHKINETTPTAFAEVKVAPRFSWLSYYSLGIAGISIILVFFFVFIIRLIFL